MTYLLLLAMSIAWGQSPSTGGTAAAESPVPSATPWITGNVDIGFRWMTNVVGSYPEYRSTVNLGAGPRLFGADMTIKDPRKRLFDYIRLRGYNWGDPYDTAHIDVRKLGIYDFNFDYRSIVYFNTVPSYANPQAPGGIDEQSFDVLRRTMTFDLTLRPGKHIVPYFGFWRNSGHGHGLNTWVQSFNNEFVVPVFLRDGTSNYHAGVRLEYNRVHVTLEEGGTTYKDDDQSDFSGLNTGDRTTPLLGQQITLTNLGQIYGIRGDSTYTKALATANPTPWIDLYAQFLFSEPKTQVHFDESAAGNFALLSSLLFYTGQQTVAGGDANQPHITANAGFDLRPWRRLRVIESWMTDRYHDAASPMIAEQLLFAPPATPQNLTTDLNYSEVVNYNQGQTDLYFDVTSKMTLRGGYRYVWGDAIVPAGPLSETGFLAGGSLRRNVALAGLNFRPSEKLALNLDYEGSSSDHIYFRTSLNDYSQGRARLRYQVLPSLTLQGNFSILNNQNPDPSIQYSFDARDSSVSAVWMPGGGKRFALTAEYDRATDHSNIRYLLPPFLSPAVSDYRDNAHTVTSTIDIVPPALGVFVPKIQLGGSFFRSSGSRPSSFYQPMGKLSFPLQKHVALNAEWLWYGFGENFYFYEGFHTHMFQVSLKLSR